MGERQAELDVWKSFLERATPAQRAAILSVLRHWQEDSDLVGVRDASTLAKLPDAERRAWQSLRTEVAGRTTRGGLTTSPPKLPDLPADVYAKP